MSTWHDTDAFWHDMRDVLFDRGAWERAPDEVDRIVALLGLEPPANVLDLGCGVGRLSIEFARRGFLVTGADRTRIYLDEAKERSTEAELEVEWIPCDMREFRREQAFDAVINIWTSFGYFDDPADDHRVLENVVASLRSGGRFVTELMGREIIAARFQPRFWRNLEDGGFLLEEREVIEDWRRIRNRWIVLRDGQRHEHVWTTRLYAGTELKDLLSAAGFIDVGAYGGLEGIPYDQKARRLVVTGMKP